MWLHFGIAAVSAYFGFIHRTVGSKRQAGGRATPIPKAWPLDAEPTSMPLRKHAPDLVPSDPLQSIHARAPTHRPDCDQRVSLENTCTAMSANVARGGLTR